MKKVDRKQVGYHGKPIDSLTREELISALEELADAIRECVARDKKCCDILRISNFEPNKS